ncbi:ParA family protein [Megalodesulfovibrio paquesii]
MNILAIANQKGGVGKTTTALNLGAALHRESGVKPLLVDMDPQRNLTRACAVDGDNRQSTFEFLAGTVPFEQVAVEGAAFDLIPSSVRLADADVTFATKIGRERLLTKGLRTAEQFGYEYVLVDCPPNLGLLSVNAFTAATHVLIIAQCEFFSLDGLVLIKKTLAEVREELNPGLTVMGVVPTLYDKRKTLNRDALKAMRHEFGDDVLTPIRDNVKLAEAPSFGKTIFEYDPECNGAYDYAMLARDILKRRT